MSVHASQFSPYGSDLGASSSFELPCSAFEQYMLIDDRPSHPMSSYLEVEISGPLHTDSLREALHKVLERHVLLHSRVRMIEGVYCDWIPEAIPLDIEVVTDGKSPDYGRMDLRKRCGLRVWLFPGTPTSRLVLDVHHATCDALGMMTFLIEWLAVYGGREDQLPPPTLKRLAGREDLSRVSASYPLVRRIANVTRYLFRETPRPLVNTPAPTRSNEESSQVASPTCDGDAKAAQPPSAYHAVKLNREELQQLRSAARARGVTLNDWMCAVLFQTIHHWNVDYGETARGPYRIVVPVNRRSAEERFLSACNKIGYKMLTRRGRQLERLDELLSSISLEMQPVRESPDGVHSFLKMLRLMSRMGILPHVVGRFGTFATVVFSNVGNVTEYFSPILERTPDGKLESGSIRVESFRCAPPRRLNTNNTIAAFSYGEELHLVSSRLGRGLDADQTLEFLNRFHDDLLKSIRSGGRHSNESTPTASTA